jgi:hypothetical protein
LDELTFRIADILSSNLGEPFSINQLNERIKKKYGIAHYANTHAKLRKLAQEGKINLISIGKSSAVKLNFQNYLLADFLAELEIKKKTQFLESRLDLIALLEEMGRIKDKFSIKSISFIDAAKNIKLNRMELLILLGEHSSSKTIDLYKETRKLQEKYNLRLDSAILDEQSFSSLLKSNEINPLREALTKEIAIFCPQEFWTKIRAIMEEKEIKVIQSETQPANIPESDMVYNLNRYGYKEFGSIMEQGRLFCIEYIATAVLLQSSARRVKALPAILAENNFNSNMLAFLNQKFQTAGKLFGLLKIAQSTNFNEELKKTLNLLKAIVDNNMAG